MKDTSALQIVENCPVCGGRPAFVRHVQRALDVAACGRCGSWYRVPRPTAEDLARIYGQDYYNAWDLDRDERTAAITKQATFEPLFPRMEAALQTGSASPKILDVGAATGLLLDVASARHWQPYAVELNPYSAGILRKKYSDSNVFEGDITQCPFPAESFDVITMTDLIEHVLDVAGALQKAAALLKKGGILLLTTPRIDSLSRRLMGARWLHFKLEHIQYFSRQALTDALAKTGLTVVQSSGLPKRLTLDYLWRQLRVYPHWLLTPLARAAHFLAPCPLRHLPLSYQCGEMIVVARK